MNSSRENNLKHNLLSLLKDLNSRDRDRYELMAMYIEDRLNKSLEEYYKVLKHSYEYLARKNELKIMRRMNRGANE